MTIATTTGSSTCPSWCTEKPHDSEYERERPFERTCWSRDKKIELHGQQRKEWFNDRRDEADIEVYLERFVGDQVRVRMSTNGDFGVACTLDEARQFAQALIDLVSVAEATS